LADVTRVAVEKFIWNIRKMSYAIFRSHIGYLKIKLGSTCILSLQLRKSETLLSACDFV